MDNEDTVRIKPDGRYVTGSFRGHTRIYEFLINDDALIDYFLNDREAEVGNNDTINLVGLNEFRKYKKV